MRALNDLCLRRLDSTRAREAPARLPEKLVQIREGLELSQDGMIRCMGVTEKITREDISKYERGVRQPSCWWCWIGFGINWYVSGISTQGERNQPGIERKI